MRKSSIWVNDLDGLDLILHVHMCHYFTAIATIEVYAHVFEPCHLQASTPAHTCSKALNPLLIVRSATLTRQRTGRILRNHWGEFPWQKFWVSPRFSQKSLSNQLRLCWHWLPPIIGLGPDLYYHNKSLPPFSVAKAPRVPLWYPDGPLLGCVQSWESCWHAEMRWLSFSSHPFLLHCVVCLINVPYRI